MNWPHFLGLYRDERIDPVIVCHISNAVAGLLGARRGRVLLSHDTMRKQVTRHPDLTEQDYGALRAMLMMGEYRQDTPTSAMILFTDVALNGCNYRAALKATADGKRLYCTSFNRLRDRQLQQARRKMHPIIKSHD